MSRSLRFRCGPTGDELAALSSRLLGSSHAHPPRGPNPSRMDRGFCLAEYLRVGDALTFAKQPCRSCHRIELGYAYGLGRECLP
jgi:hypothetical protein